MIDLSMMRRQTNMEDGLIVAFAGGLGNQMFQYGLYRRLKAEGKNVKCVITNDNSSALPFRLDIFPAAKYDTVDQNLYFSIKEAYEKRNLLKKVKGKLLPWTKDFYFENEDKPFDPIPFRMKNGIIYGYFQGLDYIEPIKHELMDSFTFPEAEPKLTELLKSLTDDYVAIHIRRGDYLTLQDKFGGICTNQYYEKAIQIMGDHGYNKFVVLSNDIEWVKENFKLNNAIYISSIMFDKYQDWYDMNIMSRCSHNIIANSTFSWWGAWLNSNPNKIVISPPYFDNLHKNKRLFEKNWIVVTG